MVSDEYGTYRMSLTTRDRPKRFKNPPIIEAIIAVTIRQLPESALVTLEGLSAPMSVLGYALEKAMTSHAVGFAIENGISNAWTGDEPAGFQFFSSDRRFAFQVLRTGLVFSQLGRYETWELFTAEAKKVWDIYLAAVGEVDLVEYRVRYINKVLIPMGEPSERYVRLHISVPPDLPQAIFNPYLRLMFMLSDPPGTLTHQQGILPPEKEGFISTLLDNDFAFPASDLAPESLWSAIDSVRKVKDDYFLGMLTDKMKEAFDA
jgi:uncharacterized protein (TIGR04255 family)